MIITPEHVEDFCSSEYFLFIDNQSKQYAHQLLSAAANKLTSHPTINSIEQLLSDTAALPIPTIVRKSFPDLLSTFLTYLGSCGTHPVAHTINEYLSVLKSSYLDRFRENGTFRGTTYAKNYTKTARNDACPCGSGKKFKKCCALLTES